MADYNTLNGLMGAAAGFAKRPVGRAAIATGTTLVAILGVAGEAAASELGGLTPAAQYLLAAGIVASGGTALAAFLTGYNNLPVLIR